MKHKSMAEMNRERALRKAKEQADKDDENPNAYYKFLDLFKRSLSQFVLLSLLAILLICPS